MKRLILKTLSDTGIPCNFEIDGFQAKHNVNINEVPRLYVSFKVGKRRKIKRLRINRTSQDCELCGIHVYVEGKVGKTPFDQENY